MMPQPQTEQLNDPTGVPALPENSSVLNTPATDEQPHTLTDFTQPLTHTSELVGEVTFARAVTPSGLIIEPSTAIPYQAQPEVGTLPDDEGTRTKTIKVPVEIIRQIDRRILGTENTFHSFCLNLIVNHDTLLTAYAKATDLREQLDQARADLRKALNRAGESDKLRDRATRAERELLNLTAEIGQLKAELNQANTGTTLAPAAPDNAPSMSAGEATKVQDLQLVLDQVKEQIADLLGEFERVSNAGETLIDTQHQQLVAQNAAAIRAAVAERDAAYQVILVEVCRYAALHSNGVNSYTQQYFLNYLGLLLKPLVDAQAQ